jgi:hypothetical protein
VRKWLLLALLLVVAGASAILQYRAQRPPRPPAPTRTELDNLVRRRDALSEQLLDMTIRRDDQGLGAAPRGQIMIGMPTALTRAVVERLVTGLFQETTLTLKNLAVRKDGKVKAKMVFKKKTVGEYELDVSIPEVQGVLKPGKPELTFEKDLVRVRLPVRLAEGHGTASLQLKWDSKGLAANAVCGDVDVVKAVGGTVAPADYLVEGTFGVKAEGETVVLTPDFGELAIRIVVQPSDASWGVVDSVIAEQRAVCREVLEKIDLKSILGKLLDRGFNVKIPKKIFKPIRLPAGVKSSLRLQGVDLALEVKPTGLVVTPDRVWYGANVNAKAKPVAPAPDSPSPANAPAPHRPATPSPSGHQS